jgi:tetraacyldisaccharide-1-P 4'-kinase
MIRTEKDAVKFEEEEWGAVWRQKIRRYREEI